MGTTYEYTYEYEVGDSNKHQRTNNESSNHFTQRSLGYQPNHGGPAPQPSRSNMMDSLVNLQHDRIWNKLYDPTELSKTAHETEIQVCEKFFSSSFVFNNKQILRYIKFLCH